ncbi:MAG: bifunctional diguanylate cyclase/phosphohydrolase [Solirubrobacterales bacterium]
MLELTPQLDPPLKARLRFTNGTSGTTRIVEDEALMARTFAFLFGVGGTLALMTLLLPGAPDRAELPFAAVVGFAYITTVTLVLAYDRLPRWVFQGAPLVGNLMITLALVFGGAQATPAYALFYYWVALTGFYFFDARWAMGCAVVASISYGAVLALFGSVVLSQLNWLMLTGGLFVTGAIVSLLRMRADQLLTQLSSAASIDALTGLPNRREFDNRLRQETARAKRVGVEFGVLRVDIDGFQPFNDSAGHHAGDMLLDQVAQLLRREVRVSDTVARLGGDEFGIIAPEAAQVDSYLLAERLRKVVREGLKGGPHPLTVSAGIAVHGRHGTTTQELIAASKQALLAAKRLGRDRTVIFSDEVATNLLELGAPHELPTSLETVLSLAELVDVNQMGSARHSQVVGRYAEAMGGRLGLYGDHVQRLRLAGVLHDVGKIGVRGSILAKPGPLTDHEMEEMRTHPEVGARIVRNAGLTDIAVWIGAHHERPDGGGYPGGVGEREIPLEARILAVADAYEAMTNDRAYRSAMTPAKAREELKLNAGTQFDPRVVDAFITLLESDAFDDVGPSKAAQEDGPSLEASSTK